MYTSLFKAYSQFSIELTEVKLGDHSVPKEWSGECEYEFA